MLRIFLPRETFDGSVLCSEPPIMLNMLELETCLSCAPFLRGKSERRRWSGQGPAKDWNHPKIPPAALVGPAFAFPFPSDSQAVHGNTLQSAASPTPSYFCSPRERAACQEHNGCCVPSQKPGHFQNGIKALQEVLFPFGAMLFLKAWWILKCSGYMGMC